MKRMEILPREILYHQCFDEWDQGPKHQSLKGGAYLYGQKGRESEDVKRGAYR